MSVRLIAGRAGSGKTRHCLDSVRTEMRRGLIDGPRLILLVPEQAALQMERALLGGEFATLGRCEVLSFRRLARRVLADAAGPLPTVLTPLGRQMLLRRIIARSRPTLRAFTGVADRPGFIARLSQSVAELIQHHVTPASLRQTAAQAAAENDPAESTLADMAELLEAYVAHLGAAQVDPEGVFDLARRHLDAADWLRGTHLWLDGFAGFTPQQMRLLVDLAGRAAHVDIALLLDPDAPGVTDPDADDDSLSLFARTQRTWHDLAAAFRKADVPIERPHLLRPSDLPRFASADLALLERTLFHVAPLPLEPTAFKDTSPLDPPAAAVRLVRASDPRAEIAAVVREVLRLTRDHSPPLRYRDIAIICRDLTPLHDLISAELNASGIPFFIDRRRATAHHPLVEWTRAAVRLHDAARFGEAAVSLFKTGLTPLADEDADLLENHVLARGVTTRQAWEETAWRAPAVADLSYVYDHAALLRARQTYVGAIGDWWPRDDAPPRRTGLEWMQQFDALMQRLGVEKRLRTWAEAARARGDFDEAQQHEQVWNDTVELMEQLAAALGDEPLSPADLAEVLDAGFAEFTLGLVPATLDQVLVGSIDRSRHPPIRAVFLVGLTDRLFPRHPTEDPILGDAERERLDKAGAPIGPPRVTALVDERMLAYIAVTRPSERLWLSFPAADADGKPTIPSSFLDAIRGALPHVTIENLTETAPPDALRAAATPAQLAECVATGLRADAVDPFVAATYDAARQSPLTQDALARVLSTMRIATAEPLTSDAALALCGGRRSTTVSRLETFAACPFQHFAKHGLRLEPRRVHELSALDLGTLYHDMLDHFVSDLVDTGRSLRDLAPLEIAARLDETRKHILPGYVEKLGLDAAQSRSAEQQIPRDLLPPLEAESHWPGDAKPAGTEITFGTTDARLPALTLHTPAGRTVELHGKIDRIDLLPAGDKRIGVILDYKRSRSLRLTLDRAFHGLSLQLLAYLLVLREHGDTLTGGTVTPAGAFLLPLLGGFPSVGHPSEAVAEGFDPFHAFRPRGVLDFDWIDTLDPALKGSGRSRTYAVHRKQDGQLGFPDQSDALGGEAFAALLDLVRRRLGELCDRWLDGEVAVRPRVLDGRLPCSRCDYAAVCRFEPGRSPVEILPTLSRTEVVDAMQNCGTARAAPAALCGTGVSPVRQDRRDAGPTKNDAGPTKGGP